MPEPLTNLQKANRVRAARAAPLKGAVIAGLCVGHRIIDIARRNNCSPRYVRHLMGEAEKVMQEVGESLAEVDYEAAEETLEGLILDNLKTLLQTEKSAYEIMLAPDRVAKYKLADLQSIADKSGNRAFSILGRLAPEKSSSETFVEPTAETAGGAAD